MKHVFIVNPTAGKARDYKGIMKRIDEYCNEIEFPHVIHITTKPKEATEFAKLYKDEECVIFSVGGDGTLNEVASGIVGTKNRLGVIPTGSGNDFYKTLAFTDDVQIKCDIGMINKNYFINIISFGLDAEVAANAELMKGKVPPSQIYNASILYTFFKFKHKKMELTLRNTTMSGMYTIVTICNGQFYGGGYHVAPDAELDDNQFDVYFANKMSKAKMPKLVLKMKKGAHIHSPLIHKIKTDHIKLVSDHELIANVDGDIIRGKEFEIELIPNAITMVNDKEMVNKILGK
ncbi:diacylglycerol/lipid kinase family protein [Treponema sp. R6D11]